MLKLKKCFSAFFIIFCLLLPSVIPAAYTWKSVIVGGGGFVDGIIYHPAQSGLAYARTDMGGAYRWDNATSQWVAITDFLTRNNSDYMGILSLAVDPNDVNRVYLETGKYTASWAGTGALLASTDKGVTWAINPLTVKIGGNEDGRGTGERLQVDPNLGSMLFMGTTADGLWKSTNYGAAWTKVAGFTPANVTFVIFDRSSSALGFATQRIFVAANNITGQSLYRSNDGGATWTLVAGQPATLMGIRADISGGNLFMTFANNAGPNNATAGAVWKYNISGSTWTNISPVLNPAYGYGGISVDAQNPLHILVSTLDLWYPYDQVWSSANGGTTWTALLWNTSTNANIATWDRTYAPWTSRRSPHWLEDIKIDPFDSNKAAFGTGYGIWGCDNLSASPTNWYFKDKVLEETVPIEIISPPTGAPLLSAMGDQGGFKHDNLDLSPASGFYMPDKGTTLSTDYAESVPAKIVKAYNAAPYGAYSTDAGVTWIDFAAYPAGTTGGGSKAVAISADGANIVWMPAGGALSYSANNGGSWTASTGGAPAGYCPESDRVNASKFYYYDPVNGAVWVSLNGGQSFAQKASGLPALASYNSGDGSCKTVIGNEGHLWITTGAGGLYRSIDSGTTATKINTVTAAYLVGFGKAASGWPYPAIYLSGIVGGALGLYRSDDTGATWTRINTDANQYGLLHTVIGDPRIYGRCYVSAEGRGAFYGDAAVAGTPTFSATYTRTATATYTRTATNTPTPSRTATASPTATMPNPSFTLTITASRTAPPTATSTATVTSTATGSFTPSLTFTYSYTASFTFTASRTMTPTYTPTGTFSINTPTFTGTFTETWTTVINSPTDTYTAVNTATRTAIDTATPPALTYTSSATCTRTFTQTYTPTAAITATITPTYTGSRTHTVSPTNTPFAESPTDTPTTTLTYTSTVTCTYTDTPTLTMTQTSTHSATGTSTILSATATVTPTASDTATTNTPTATPTLISTIVALPIEVKNTLAYPNPCDSGSGITIGYELTHDASEIIFKLYTTNFRLIRKHTASSPTTAGIKTMFIGPDVFESLSRGIYLYVIEAKDDNGTTGRSKINTIVIIR